MPEPVSNAEVEDVLASIRRLVSEDKRATTPSAAPAESGKLMLTPALRVAEPEVKDENTISSSAENAAESDLEAQDIFPEADPTADTDAPVDIATGGAPSASAQAEPDVEDDAPIDHDKLAAENARMAAELVLGKGRGQTDAGMSDTVRGSDVSEAETGAPSYDAAVAVSEDVAAKPEEMQSHQPEIGQAPEATALEEARQPGTASQQPTSLSAKIAALEAAVGRRQDDWEPDGVAESEPYSGTEPPMLAWEDVSEDSAETDEDVSLSADHHDSPSPADEDVTADLLDEPALLDEEALRDMVAEIVREELQGALGERITRNVRKLVRREIQRALAAHDLG